MGAYELIKIDEEKDPDDFWSEPPGSYLRHALASYAAHLLEKMPKDSGLNAPANIQAWQLGVDNCRSILQAEIDGLMKKV